MTNKIKPYTAFQEWFGTKLIKNYGSLQTWLYEVSGGRLANRFMGVPCAILTTTGRKTGKKRKTPLLYIEDNKRIIIAATKGGMSTAPIWYLNLMANPDVDFQIASHKRRMKARKANAEEAAELWPKLDSIYSGYAEYRQRLQGIREAPVIILEEQ